jgi:vacuolar-type H+-ATPase subunit C/Vma6
MDKEAASSFVYAKASGILSRSFIGERANLLFEAKNLSQLWSAIFSEEVPLIPENLLADEIEKKSVQAFVDIFIKLISCYDKPDKLFLSLLHEYEYANIKQCVASVMNKEAMPAVVELGNYSGIKYQYYPDLQKMTNDTVFSFINHIPDSKEYLEMCKKLDDMYITEIYDAVNSIQLTERSACKKLLFKQLQLKNVIWAARLMVFYGMTGEQILPLLSCVSDNVLTDEIASKAVKVLDLSPDDYQAWKKTEFSFLLNPCVTEVSWKIDPIWMENVLNSYVAKNAKAMFHQYPFTACVLICFFLLKKQELNYIRTVSEGLRLAADISEMKI